LVVDSSSVVDIKKVVDSPVVDIQPSLKVVDIFPVVDNSKPARSTTDQVLEVVDKPKLWSNYYSCKKPFCLSCHTKGIPDTAYAFCSLAKDTSEPSFPNLYFCQVYHWTVYQGQPSCLVSKAHQGQGKT
jgi:hypothetical protein